MQEYGGRDRRPVRPSARRGQAQVSSDEDDEAPMLRPPSRAARKRQIDFTKLETLSLQRYRKLYKLGDAPPSTPKEDLIPAIARHFAQQAVDEDDVLVNFAFALNKHSGQINGGAMLLPNAKKARTILPPKIKGR